MIVNIIYNFSLLVFTYKKIWYVIIKFYSFLYLIAWNTVSRELDMCHNQPHGNSSNYRNGASVTYYQEREPNPQLKGKYNDKLKDKLLYILIFIIYIDLLINISSFCRFWTI